MVEEYTIDRPVIVRIYGKLLNTWSYTDDEGREIVTQFELAYKDYNSETGDLVAVGSEDFSQERYKTSISWKMVWTWDGVRYNKGGKRAFDFWRDIRFRKSDGTRAVKDYLLAKHYADQQKYPDLVKDIKVIQFR